MKPENILLTTAAFENKCPRAQHGNDIVPAHPAVHQQWVLFRQRLLHMDVQDAACLSGVAASLCDFGSAHIGPGRLSSSPFGTSSFSAPEVMAVRRAVSAGRRCAAYDPFKADVWSFGATLFQAMVGQEPFPVADMHCPQFVDFLAATQGHAPGPSKWSWPTTVSPALVHLLSQCLVHDPRQRCDMAAVRAHPWFKGARTAPPPSRPRLAPHWPGQGTPRLARQLTPELEGRAAPAEAVVPGSKHCPPAECVGQGRDTAQTTGGCALGSAPCRAAGLCISWPKCCPTMGPCTGACVSPRCG